MSLYTCEVFEFDYLDSTVGIPQEPIVPMTQEIIDEMMTWSQETRDEFRASQYDGYKRLKYPFTFRRGTATGTMAFVNYALADTQRILCRWDNFPVSKAKVIRNVNVEKGLPLKTFVDFQWASDYDALVREARIDDVKKIIKVIDPLKLLIFPGDGAGIGCSAARALGRKYVSTDASPIMKELAEKHGLDTRQKNFHETYEEYKGKGIFILVDLLTTITNAVKILQSSQEEFVVYDSCRAFPGASYLHSWNGLDFMISATFPCHPLMSTLSYNFVRQASPSVFPPSLLTNYNTYIFVGPSSLPVAQYIAMIDYKLVNKYVYIGPEEDTLLLGIEFTKDRSDKPLWIIDGFFPDIIQYAQPGMHVFNIKLRTLMYPELLSRMIAFMGHVSVNYIAALGYDVSDIRGCDYSMHSAYVRFPESVLRTNVRYLIPSFKLIRFVDKSNSTTKYEVDVTPFHDVISIVEFKRPGIYYFDTGIFVDGRFVVKRHMMECRAFCNLTLPKGEVFDVIKIEDMPAIFTPTGLMSKFGISHSFSMQPSNMGTLMLAVMYDSRIIVGTNNWFLNPKGKMRLTTIDECHFLHMAHMYGPRFIMSSLFDCDHMIVGWKDTVLAFGLVDEFVQLYNNGNISVVSKLRPRGRFVHLFNFLSGTISPRPTIADMAYFTLDERSRIPRIRYTDITQ